MQSLQWYRMLKQAKDEETCQLDPNVKQSLIVQLLEVDGVMTGYLFINNLANKTLFLCEVLPEDIHSKQGFVAMIGRILAESPQVKLLVLGVPGVEIQSKLKIIDFLPLYYSDLRGMILEKFDIEILIENDVNAAMFGRSRELNNRDEVYVSLYCPTNSPPGVGVVVNGQILHGKHGMSGEIKYLPALHDLKEIDPPKKKSAQNLKCLLQTIICMYDPGKIFLYLNGPRYSQVDVEAVRQELCMAFPYFHLPSLERCSTFEEDYYQGLAFLALERLQKIR